MEKNSKTKAAAPAQSPQKTWNPRPEYLRSVTLKAAIRENRYVDREVVEKHWREANPPEPKEETDADPVTEN